MGQFMRESSTNTKSMEKESKCTGKSLHCEMLVCSVIAVVSVLLCTTKADGWMVNGMDREYSEVKMALFIM